MEACVPPSHMPGSSKVASHHPDQGQPALVSTLKHNLFKSSYSENRTTCSVFPIATQLLLDPKSIVTKRKAHSWMAGIAPAQAPRLIIHQDSEPLPRSFQDHTSGGATG